ncbi:MAG: ABC transporter ATP-binding protein [Kordiimonadaceae bacterium]|jgi:NitT/TauT family transport system ATP-binding protein|nr:ABC transporter ATP-binding protein [Kordiimonadaceae bacterium]MBT6033694.1 ABC transporter ATP-binding protein [Kordiimonadaceae bacterium]
MENSKQIDAPTITINGVSKIYPGKDGAEGVKALEDVTTNIKDCEFVSIIGPSGCGKSTLLKVLAGLIPYEAGDVTICDKVIEGTLDEVGVVFQTPNLLPWLTIGKNLSLGAEMRGFKSKEIKPDIEAMVKVMSLDGFEDRYPHELSGGMQQRVSIGQALLYKPQVLLMDEPFGALDALTRDRLNMELLRIWQAEKKTVVLITHSIAEAVLLSDRVIVMSERPACILEEIIIDLPRPRDPRATREMSKFGDYVVRLGALMGVV